MARAAKPGQSMTELLRAALRDAPSLNQVEQATGLKRQALAKFLRGEQSLRLDLADKLAEYFGIESRFKGR
jgi:plasmid maintenance system antidote protein VapI